DYRRPALTLAQRVDDGPEHETQLEQYFYTPGQFKHERNAGGETPVADDKAVARHTEEEGARRAQFRLEAHRARKRVVTYQPNVIDLWPGRVFRVARHPRADLVATPLMAVAFEIVAEEDADWVCRGEAVAADVPFRPHPATPKPRVDSVQCAVIVGPAGEEIYTDEFGRVRVQFPWDREGQMDDNSSCWMRVSQGWAGAGYGGIQIPRVGHEVLIAFVEGDPDQPLVVGRVYNQQTPVPFSLPENKTVSTIRSDTSPHNGGFNELRFEDAQGREHVYLQAEKDLSSLVKHDAMSVVGNNEQHLVRGNQAATVAGNRAELTKMNDTETVGMNRVSTVGMNRNATVGMTDTSFIGNMWSVTIARNLAGPLNLGLQAAYGAMSSVLSGSLGSTLGQVSSTPLGLPFSGGELGPMRGLDAMSTPLMGTLAGIAAKTLSEDEGVPATGIAMRDKKITLTTGGATVVLDGPDVIISAAGNIRMNAQKKIEIMSESDDIIIQGGPMVKINPGVKPPEARCLKGAAAEGAAFIGGSLP
ncbi:MAG: type VI secretion system tip protein TssI/VgrG, partial [Myxococcota bacterium]